VDVLVAPRGQASTVLYLQTRKDLSRDFRAANGFQCFYHRENARA
jgi:hypothetical protein